ncbi:hypothetical protein, partial [Streptomyces europaeiscabiei]|uniref:hypothetical protein n=1 Tax=Streptomyces europaeiscabiei TaxID=146819 RepID=UPI0038F6BBD1
MGLFSTFCPEAALACRATECRGANAIAKSGAAAIHSAHAPHQQTFTGGARGLGRERMQRTARLLVLIAGLCASELST